MKIVIETILLHHESFHVHFDREKWSSYQTLWPSELKLKETDIANQEIDQVHVNLKVEDRQRRQPKCCMVDHI